MLRTTTTNVAGNTGIQGNQQYVATSQNQTPIQVLRNDNTNMQVNAITNQERVDAN